MKTIAGWNDLARYGIVPLTGEACGLMYRILCDVTAPGQRILEKCLGCELKLPESWNGGTEAEPHVGSVLLAREMLVPIGIFALLESGCREVWLSRNGSLLGIEPTDSQEQIAQYRKMCPEGVARSFAYRGTAGDRNVHMMTGRIV